MIFCACAKSFSNEALSLGFTSRIATSRIGSGIGFTLHTQDAIAKTDVVAALLAGHEGEDPATRVEFDDRPFFPGDRERNGAAVHGDLVFADEDGEGVALRKCDGERSRPRLLLGRALADGGEDEVAGGIVEFRERNGLKDLSDLLQVRGIGPKTVNRIEPWVELRSP